MKIIPVDYRTQDSTTGDVKHTFKIIQLIVDRGQVRKNAAGIAEFYESKLTVDMNTHPMSFKVEVIDPEECGLKAVVLHVVASYHDVNKSRFANVPEACEIFFDEEVLIPIEATGMFGTGVADTVFKTNGYHSEYLIARENASQPNR